MFQSILLGSIMQLLCMVLVSGQHSRLTHGRLLAELSQGLLASRAVVHAEVARCLAELRVRPHTIL